MTRRSAMFAGGALGAFWAALVVWVGAQHLNLPIITLIPTISFALLGPGLTLAPMILWAAIRRFTSDAFADGGAPVPNGPDDIDRRVLTNTIEQSLLALCIWPATGFLAADDGPGLLVALGISFPLAQLAFWVGYRMYPPLRMVGFSATFYATLFAFVWSVFVWIA